VKLEQKRDQEYSLLKIQHWEELYQASSLDIQKLERQIEELQTNFHSQKKELEILRPKLAELEENKGDLLSQLKLHTNKMEYEERIALDRILKLERDLQEAENKIENLIKEREQLMRELSEKEERMHANERESIGRIDRMKVSCEEKISALVESHEKKREIELELLRADLEADYITQLSDHETEMNDNLIQFKEINEKLTREVNQLRKEKTHFEELYEEEKTESGALRLRMQMISNQSNQNQPPLLNPPPAEGKADPHNSRIAPQSVKTQCPSPL
jgi:chromosome segregation ATPase